MKSQVLVSVLRTAALLADALAPGCTAEPLGVAQCRQYGGAYCDYLARCADSGRSDALEQPCRQAFDRAMDCGKASAVTSGFDECLGALASARCTGAVPAACAGVARNFPIPCARDPSAPPEVQAQMLADCPAEARNTGYLTEGRVRDLDVLFVVDNSPSMSPKQAALARSLPRFVQRLQATASNYHIAVATSDIGSNVAPGTTWGGSAGACDTYEGDDGGLQLAACTTRTQVTAEARSACAALCPDDKFVPTGGQRFVSRVDGRTNVPVALELDPMTGKMIDTGPQKALRCMALVGDARCGIEGPLEAAKRALDGHRADNTGFLRASSVLAVIFVTDEDDCSVRLNKRVENGPISRDCDPAQPDSYDCYNADYRCLARSLQCNETLLLPGVKTGCTERPDSYLESVDKYATFFQRLRPADRLLIGGIWTLPSLPSGGRLEITRTGGPTTPFLNRAGGTGASCTYAADPNVYGEAQLRLSRFAGQIPGSIESSICDLDGYGAALDRIADRLVTKFAASCLPKPPRTVAGQPDCLVRNRPDRALPVCSSTCCDAWASTGQPTPEDEGIRAACATETADACYCALPSRIASVCPGGAVLGIWRRGGAPVAQETHTLFSCLSP